MVKKRGASTPKTTPKTPAKKGLKGTAVPVFAGAVEPSPTVQTLQPSTGAAATASTSPAQAARKPASEPKIANELRRRLPELFAEAPEPKNYYPLPHIPPILLAGDRPLPAAKPRASQPASPPSIAEKVTGAHLSELPAAVFHPVPTSEPVPLSALRSATVPEAPGPAFFQPTDSPTPSSPPPFEPRFPAEGTLWLTARDPFCVCAHWQLDAAALAAFAGAHAGGSWWLRLRAGSTAGWLVNEQPLPRGADYRFIPVLTAGTPYVAEVGYRYADGSWRGLALSAPTFTPPDAPAAFSPEPFVGRAFIAPVTPESLRETPPDHSEPIVHPPNLPSPVQAERLITLVWEPVRRQEVPSSAEVTEWEARAIVTEIPGEAGPGSVPSGLPASGELTGAVPAPVPSIAELPASEAPVQPVAAPPPGFWFKVNAEVILYGSTERDARVTIAGRPVALRPDGSFSFRFALPDGDFTLPAVAVNAAGTDSRSASVQFTRATVLTGEVGVHPQNPALRPPVAEAIGGA